jgi:AraC family transcriptional regulator, regulatory protein of adaptative response / methylated-DNA-[protein]-cysteine methyltransferase
LENPDYTRIEKTIHYLQDQFPGQPGLDELAQAIGVSPFHFQRLFQRWAGVTPKKFLQYLSLGYAKRRLQESRSLLDTAYGAGLSAPSRLHDLFLSVEAMTPGQYKSAGKGLRIGYSFFPTPFGEAVGASTALGICGLSFVKAGRKKAALDEVRSAWPRADLREREGKHLQRLKRHFSGRPGKKEPLKALLAGTPFQLKVWEALLRIPEGSILSYRDLARMIGKPEAARAVGSAIGKNPIAYLIPCHRVIREAGVIGDYRWGRERKKAILAREAGMAGGSQDKMSMNSPKESTIQSGSAAERMSRVP